MCLSLIPRIQDNIATHIYPINYENSAKIKYSVFLSCPKHDSHDTMSHWKQTFFVIKMPCPGV
jgi:hypothetical protein